MVSCVVIHKWGVHSVFLILKIILEVCGINSSVFMLSLFVDFLWEWFLICVTTKLLWNLKFSFVVL